MARSLYKFFLIAVALSFSGSLQAALITYVYEGSVDYVSDNPISILADISVGDKFTGKFIVDDSQNTPTHEPWEGESWFSGALSYIEITYRTQTAGDLKFSSNSPSSSVMQSEVPGFPQDKFFLGENALSSDTDKLGIRVWLSDEDGGLFDDVDVLDPGILPLTDLNRADSWVRYYDTVTGRDSDVRGSLTLLELEAIPIPAALPLFGSALTLMGFVGWRKKKLQAG